VQIEMSLLAYDLLAVRIEDYMDDVGHNEGMG